MLMRYAVLLLVLASSSPSFAEEKIDNISVELGVISWSDIQRGLGEKPATHAEEYHLKMARKMAEMHGGGFQGAYHVLVVLKDRTTGKYIKDADLQVTARAKTGTDEIAHRLESMTMDGFAGYGRYFNLSSDVSYVFEIKFSLKGKKRHYSVMIEKSLPK